MVALGRSPVSIEPEEDSAGLSVAGTGVVVVVVVAVTAGVIVVGAGVVKKYVVVLGRIVVVITIAGEVRFAPRSCDTVGIGRRVVSKYLCVGRVILTVGFREEVTRGEGVVRVVGTGG